MKNEQKTTEKQSETNEQKGERITEMPNVNLPVLRDEDGEEFETVKGDISSFEVVEFKKEGDVFKGNLIGDYLSVCEQMGVKPKPKFTGWLFATDKGLKLVNKYHAVDAVLNTCSPLQRIRIERGSNVYAKGVIDFENTKPKYVNFTVSVAKVN